MKKEKIISEKKLNKNIEFRKKCFTASTLVFFITMLLTMLFALCLWARPTFSESEKRALTPFPKFTTKSLLSGEYFDDINTWFADTMPMRDTLIKGSSLIKKGLGLNSKINNLTVQKKEDIPEHEALTQQTAEVTTVKKSTEKKQEVNTLPKLQVPTHTAVKQDGDSAPEQSLGAIFIKGNCAYEYYNFVKDTADLYAKTINKASKKLLDKSINVYNMLIPTSIDITLDKKTRDKLNTDNQQEAISYITSSISKNVTPVLCYDILKNHSDEYIYFRTDHHWTALGAYYAYAQYTSVASLPLTQLTDFTEHSFDGFLGSFYSDTDKNSSLEKTPDTVYAYTPDFDVDFKVKFDNDSDYSDWPLVCDATDYSENYKYLCFIGGDNPISVITNNSIDSSRKCLLVKESFGNAFAPFLSCNYKDVYIIDYRQFDGNIVDKAVELGVDDVIFQNNISMTRNSDLVKMLDQKT